jgi:uncharacterized membrane-anchored protein
MTIASCALRAALLAALATAPSYSFAYSEPAAASSAAEQTPADAEEAKADAVLKSVSFKTGTVAVPGAHATLNLAPGYSFLSATDAQHVLTNVWGNPPDTDILGMIVHGTDAQVLTDDNEWAVVVTYSNDGYVKDDDAGSIDYDDLLKDMKKSTVEDNADRIKQGYPAIELVGWAARPRYDAAAHKLYWARELKVTNKSGEVAHSLNYDIRVLGRNGYLQLSAISPLGLLPKVEADMPQVLAMTNFDEGTRYADFDGKKDKIAAYGIGALVAGGIAAKAGLFAKLGLMLLALKKFVIIGIAAIGGAISKIFRKKKAD